MRRRVIMKKRNIVFVAVLCAGMMLSACGAKETEEATLFESAETVTEAVQESAQTETQDVAKDVQDVQTWEAEQTEGSESVDAPADVVDYSTTTGLCGASLRASDKDQAGQFNEWGTLNTIVYEATLEGDSIIAKGTMDYRNVAGQDSITVSEDTTHVFKVDDNTVYEMRGGEDGAEVISKEEFAEYLTSLIDTGLFFEVELNEGVVTTASISS
jgi:hypothetical protein